MNWQDAVRIHRIPKLYEEASLSNASLIPPGIVKIGKEWVRLNERPSLFLYGTTGCGKTYFLISLFRGVLASYSCPFPMIYIKSTSLDRNLLDASRGSVLDSCGYQTSEDHLLNIYSETQILFIDDLGSESSSERVRRQYGVIIDTRISNKLPTVYTSNIPPEEIEKLYGDRTASRLQLATNIQFPCVDHRKHLNWART